MMAIRPNDVKLIRDDVVDQVEKEIDLKLKEVHLPDSGTLDLIVSGDPNRCELEILKKRYQGAGWREVEFKTSRSNKERPGLVSVTLGIDIIGW